MPSSDKDGLRGRYCKPEKCRYQRRAIPISRRSAESLFLAEGQFCAFAPSEEQGCSILSFDSIYITKKKIVGD